MAAVTSLSLAACSADTPEESQYQSQVVSADYAGDFTAATPESQPTEEQSTAAADNAPSAEAAQSTTAVSTSAATPETAEESQPTEEQSATVADSAPSAEAAQSTTAVSTSAATPETAEGSQPESLPEDGTYSSRDDVALYIHTYGHLPGNFITKKEARELGWSGGSVEEYAPGKCIGGDHFGNYEGLLPEKSGRSYTECDIDTLGSSGRGAKRIIFSNDGLIYYTDDHYASFTLLYGEE
ncbi:MAG TPA: ribonuclease [Ruminococcaceae bacterium]|nr:ribonuclease [Oscillospiraceae bacterium]